MIRRALLVAGLVLASALPASADDPIVAKAYAIRFRPLADAAELVGQVLSAEGTVTMQPRLRTITVQDRASIQERIPGLLLSFDLAPRNVEVTLALFLGTDRREREAGRSLPAEGMSREVRGVVETLADFTKWNAYESLGGRSVTSAEGSPAEVQLGEEYRARWVVEAVAERQEVSKLRDFTLERRIVGTDGREAWQVVYRTDIVAPQGKQFLLGVAQNPDSKKALFLSLQARTR